MQHDDAAKRESMPTYQSGTSKRIQQLHLLPGTRVGDFRILSDLGRGAMAHVYHAVNESVGLDAALKVMYNLGDEELRARWKREAQSLYQLLLNVSNPHIIKIHHAGEHTLQPQTLVDMLSNETVPYIAMEFVLGPTLARCVRKDILPPPRVKNALIIASRIAHGLADVHDAGIIHRDLKPSNIIMAQELNPKIIDFGIVEIEGAADLTQRQDRLHGTRAL